MDQIGIFDFVAPLWRYEGTQSWHFLTVPADVSDDIDELTAGLRRGFGSVRVEVTVGSTSWRTSAFSDRKRGGYLLPMKKEVRLAEHLTAGNDVRARLELLDL